MDWLWLLLLGFGSGALGILVGAGGGFILGPALLIFNIFDDIPPSVVAGTVLATVAVNSFSGSVTYLRMGLVDRRSGLLFAAAALPGSVLAPFVVTEVAPNIFRVLFGLLLLGLAIRMLVHRHPHGENKPNTGLPIGGMVRGRHITSRDGNVYKYQFHEGLVTSFNLVLGFVSSFFGTGGGFVRTPILVHAFGFPVKVAVATSVFALSFYTTAGAITHGSLGNIDWYPTFLWAGIGLVVGGQLGARLAGKMQVVWILRVLVALLLVMGIRLVMLGFQG